MCFEIPKIINKPIKPEIMNGEEILHVAFDLGIKTGDMPIALVYLINDNREMYVTKMLKNNDAIKNNKKQKHHFRVVLFF